MLRVGLIILSLVGLAVLLVAGYALPGNLISDGVSDFEGDDRARAEWALSIATGGEILDEGWPRLDRVIEELLTTAYRVERVERCENAPPDEPHRPPIGLPSDPPLPEDRLIALAEEGRAPGPGNFSYEAQRYTLFGIPYVVETEAEAELCDFTL